MARMLGYNFYYDLTTSFSHQYAIQVKSRLPADPESFFLTVNSQLLPYLDIPHKIALYNDATFANLYGYYNYFSNLSPWDRWQCFRNEKRALQRADYLFFASDWAAQSAIRDFGANPAKVHVLPFGANLEQVPSSQEIAELIKQRTLKPIRLLWVGVDFERKGGALAVEIAGRLSQQGYETVLTLAGVETPPLKNLPSFVVNAGRINKDSPDGEARLIELYRQADIFILPSYRECYGVVFAEASAFGLPILAFHTGGVPTIVKQSENGWLFSSAASPDEFSQKILELASDKVVYQSLALGARKAYDERLNWSLVSRRMREILWPDKEKNEPA